jgi:IclR family acetate operon transcriptional repressor
VDVAGGSGVQSVTRALDLLEAVAAAGGVSSLADLALDLRLPAATAHRLARTLVEAGYLRQLPDRRYALGEALVALGEAARAVSRSGLP